MVAVRASLQVRQRQIIALTPSMRHSLQLLRMPALDLLQEIQREASENPFLTMRHRAGAAGSASQFDMALDTVAARPSLVEGLRAQIGAMSLSADVRASAEYLAGELRDDGYLDDSLEAIAATTGVGEETLLAGLRALQACEPTGVGARDLSECLALQLGDHGIDRDLADVVVAHLAQFADERWTSLGKLLELPRGRLRQIAAALRTLDPHPVQADGELTPPLVPDLLVERKAGGGLSVRLSREAEPGLALDDALLARMGDLDDPFTAAARVRAEGLIRAVRGRGATLMRIGQQILVAQARFFTDGAEHLHPMSRQSMADELAMHPSTLGRAVAGKALAFEGTLYPLSMFFSVALPRGDGMEVSAHAVRIAIRRMIEHEPPGAPLSDEAIRRMLCNDGVDISRRTVAKYRGCMRIPPSRNRRRTRTSRS